MCVSGQLLHWAFDEDDGAIALDASSNDRNGATANVVRIDSPRGRALEFDRTGGSARRDGDLDLINQDVAISAWVRAPMLPVAEGNREIASYGDIYGLRINEVSGIRFFVRQSLGWDGLNSPAAITGRPVAPRGRVKSQASHSRYSSMACSFRAGRLLKKSSTT